MKKAIVLAVLMAGLVPAAQAKPFWKSKSWWVGTAIIGGSLAADANSTCGALSRGVETNRILGPHPSCGKVNLLTLGAFGGYTALHAIEWHVGHDDPNKVIRAMTPWMLPGVVAGIHGTAAIHNYRLEK